MNWLALILAFGFSAIMAGFLVRLTARSRPAWSGRRRLWTAALVLPGFIVGLTLGGMAWVALSGPGAGENMQDLALIVTASVGAIFAGLSLVGGLVGASLGARR